MTNTPLLTTLAFGMIAYLIGAGLAYAPRVGLRMLGFGLASAAASLAIFHLTMSAFIALTLLLGFASAAVADRAVAVRIAKEIF